MINFSTNPEQIKEAARTGVITEADYYKWLGLQNYSSMLQKSEKIGDISKSTYEKEIASTKGYYFERDRSHNTLKFTLHCPADHTPLDLIKTHTVIKSIKHKPLQSSSKVNYNASLNKMNEAADKIWKLADEVKTRRK